MEDRGFPKQYGTCPRVRSRAEGKVDRGLNTVQSASYLCVVHLGLYSLPLSAFPHMTLTEENPF